MNKSFDYVVHSTDEKNYNRLRCNLPHPFTNNSKMLVTTLTTVCRMILINTDDYITFNDNYTIKFNNEFANLDTPTFIVYFNKLANSLGVKIIAGIDNVDRITIYSDTNITITDISYNLKLLFGLYNKNISKSEPLTSKQHSAEPIQSGSLPDEISTIKSSKYYSIAIKSVGYTNSTPVMYLLSNIGEQCFRTIDQNLVSGMRVVMKINNSFSYGSPIIHPNGDFEVQLPSSDLSSLEFVLVDAYMHEVKLLSPMFLTIHVTPISDEQLVPHPTTATYNAPVYYDYIPRPHLKTKEEDKQPTFHDALLKAQTDSTNEMEMYNFYKYTPKPIYDYNPFVKSEFKYDAKTLFEKDHYSNEEPIVNPGEMFFDRPVIVSHTDDELNNNNVVDNNNND